MLDRTIPFFNTILRCDRYTRQEISLPQGYSILPYRDGFENAWAELEFAIRDFDSVEEARQYFVETYLQDRDQLDRILFAVAPDGTVVGTCIAWQDLRADVLVSSLHWLVVDENHQGLGLGRALCQAVMNIYEAQGRFPVYIHTQPWSWKAIFLYLSLGFKLQKSDAFSHYVNQYDQAMAALQNVVSQKQYLLLLEASQE